MFKTALRLSALMLIVAGAFYSGRASICAKPEPAAAENASKYFPLCGLKYNTLTNRNLEFHLQKTLSIFDAANETLLPECTTAKKKWILNQPDLLYHLEWDEESNHFIYHDDQRFNDQDDKIDDQNAALLNKWCDLYIQFDYQGDHPNSDH
jgi:hypothetical protein